MVIKRLKNSLCNSITWVLIKENYAVAIDCGDVAPISKWIRTQHAHLVAVFITHGHFDHIYGLNELLEDWPDCKIYVSEHGHKELFDPKLNYSRYQGEDFVLSRDNCLIIHDEDEIKVIDHIVVKVIATPGHDEGCLSFIIDKYFFTGDSYIPGVKTVTNLRGNKAEALVSEDKIRFLAESQSLIVCAGHGK